MAIDPATVGAIGNVIGGVLGGLGGGGGPNWKDYMASLRGQAKVSREDIPLRAQAYRDAGIHPLFGMAGQQYAPAPTSIGLDNDPSPVQMAGQAIGRAAQAYMTHGERKKAEIFDALNLEHMGLQNDLLRSQITRISTATNPAFPAASAMLGMAGQGNSSAFEQGMVPDVGLARAQSGLPAIVPAEAVKQRIEDMVIPEMQWYLRQAMNTKTPPGTGYDIFTGEVFPRNESSVRGLAARVKDTAYDWWRYSDLSPSNW